MSEENAATEVVENSIVENPENDSVSEDASIEAPVEDSADIAAEAAEEADLSPEEEAELEAIIDEAQEEGADAEDVVKLVETFKFKSNGKEKEVTIDWKDKASIIKQLELAAAAQPAMQKASEMEKLYEENQRRTKENPWDVIKELGLDPDELAEMRIQQRIDEMKKTPEQLAQESMEKELQELRDKVKKEKEDKEAAEFARLQQEQEKELENDIMEAIDATTQLSRSPYAIKRIADTMLHAMDNGYKDVTAKQVAPLVEKEIRNEIQSMIDNMPSEYMEEFFGKKAMEKLRKNRLAKAKQIKNAKKITETAKPQPKEEKKERISMKDFMKRR
jgi:hypothetical protein